MSQPLIAISGKLKSGKTTLADALVEELGIPRRPLADPIKQAALHLGDTDPYGSGKLRWLQQGIGNLCTGYDTNYFVKLWFDHYNTDQAFGETGAVVDDVRRVPEYEAFRDSGFLLIRLHVSRETQIARGAPDDATLDDPTETGLDHLEWDQDSWHLMFPENTAFPIRLAQVVQLVARSRGEPVPTLTDLLDAYEKRYDAAGRRIGQAVS